MEKDGEVQIINDIQGKVAFTCVSASRGGSGGVFVVCFCIPTIPYGALLQPDQIKHSHESCFDLMITFFYGFNL